MAEIPKELTPLNIHAWLFAELGLCGCSEMDAALEELSGFLRWVRDLHTASPRINWDDLYECPGTFYIVAGAMDRAGLIDHGTSIRFPFLSDEGKAILDAIERHGISAIVESRGEAYDGLWYGDME